MWWPGLCRAAESPICSLIEGQNEPEIHDGPRVQHHWAAVLAAEEDKQGTAAKQWLEANRSDCRAALLSSVYKSSAQRATYAPNGMLEQLDATACTLHWHCLAYDTTGM